MDHSLHGIQIMLSLLVKLFTSENMLTEWEKRQNFIKEECKKYWMQRDKDDYDESVGTPLMLEKATNLLKLIEKVIEKPLDDEYGKLYEGV